MTMTKPIRRITLLSAFTMLTMFGGGAQTHAGGLEEPENPVVSATNIVGAGICNESSIHMVVDVDQDAIYLLRPNGTWWNLADHGLKLGFGSTLRSVTIEVDVLQSGNWALWTLAPGAEAVSSIPSSSAGIMSVTLMRPSTTKAWEFGVYLPATFQDPSTSIPVPDLVIEPQTGCPEDTGSVVDTIGI